MLAGVGRLELPTLGLEIRCSVLLSYTPKLYGHDSDRRGGKSNMWRLKKDWALGRFKPGRVTKIPPGWRRGCRSNRR